MTDTTTANTQETRDNQAILEAKQEFLDLSREEQLAFISWAEANKDAVANQESKKS